MYQTLTKTALASAVSLAMASSLVQAEETPDNETVSLEEVIVTAQKREQNLQDTPVAVTAFDADAIKDQVIHDASDISATTPNVQIVQSPGGSTSATVAIRGANMVNPAVTWEPAVGIYLDGVFIAKNTGGLFDVAELERIEVLRGPQGTLYGKNTTGGAINLITRKPGEEAGAKVKLGMGNYGYTEFGVSADYGNIADVARFGFSYVKRDRDGFYDNNSATSEIDELKALDTEAGRVVAAFDLTDQVELTYAYDWSEKNNTVAFGQLEVPPGILSGDFSLGEVDRADSAALNGVGDENSMSEGHSLTLTYDIDENHQFKSITAQRDMEFNDATDIDGTDIDAATVTAMLGGNPDAYLFYSHATREVEYEQLSQEFQFAGSSEALNYIVGVFFFDEKADASNPFESYLTIAEHSVPADGVYTTENFYGLEGTSYALYGQLDWSATDELTVTTGLRWNTEEKEVYVNKPTPVIGYESEADESWDNVSPMIALSYAANDDMTAYVRVASGWKAGGFNAEAGTKVEAETPYDEETLTAYEIGLKARWLDNRLQTNFAIFFNDIDDLQVSTWDNNAKASLVGNAGQAEMKGFELETVYLATDELTVFLNYGYLDAEYKEFNDPVYGEITDTALFPYAPEHTASVGLEYVEDLSFAQLRGRLDYSYTDEQDFYFDPGFAGLTTHAEDFFVVNARIALTDMSIGKTQTMEMGAWVKNLTDEEYRQNGFPGTLGGINFYGDPRTVGVDVTFNF